MFMSRFMLRGLMSLKYDDLPKHFERSTCDGWRTSDVLPNTAPDAAAATLPFGFLAMPLPAADLPTSVSDMYDAPTIALS